MTEVLVNLEKKSYTISIGETFEALETFLEQKKYGRVFLIADVNTARLDFFKDFESSSKMILPFCGEDNKSLAVYENVCSWLILQGITRKDCVVAFGGGTVGDLVGFVAATVLRGVSFVQIPTTLLAMVDSSVGGKVAINTKEHKNMIGTFYQPDFVLCNLSLLEILPRREVLCGMGEVLKYGIACDIDFLNYLKHFDGNFVKLVEQSCKIKSDIVCIDEKDENGVREVLNFGHTFAHAFEKMDGDIKHGEAVSFGMMIASFISLKMGFISTSDFSLCFGATKSFDLLSECLPFLNKIVLDPQKSALLILEKMSFDKKNSIHETVEIKGVVVRRYIRLVLLEKVGKCKLLDVEAREIFDYLVLFLQNEMKIFVDK